MKVLKWIGIVAAVYVAFVALFGTVFLGMFQPSFEGRGIPMLVITTTEGSGEARDRMLARMETDGELYVSAHHWSRGWYQRALENPQVSVEIGGTVSNCTAVPVDGDEFDRVAGDHPLPLAARFLIGFPPPRNLLRLDCLPVR